MREPFALPELAVRLSGPLAAAIRAADLHAVVERARRALPRRQRNALVLRELGGLSYHELGRALGVSHSAVESLSSRAATGACPRRRSHAASLGVACVSSLRVVPDQTAIAWKVAGAAVGVGVVASGAGGVCTHTALRDRTPSVRPSSAVPSRASSPQVVRTHVTRARKSRARKRAAVVRNAPARAPERRERVPSTRTG
jgi:hypothetical protein